MPRPLSHRLYNFRTHLLPKLGRADSERAGFDQGSLSVLHRGDGLGGLEWQRQER